MAENEHLRALVNELHPGKSGREICAAAGVPESRLRYWLSTSIPTTLAQIYELARILDCEPVLVQRAVRADHRGGGTLLLDELTDDERRWLCAYREMDEEQRVAALQSRVELTVDERTLLSVHRRLDEVYRRKLIQIALVLDTDG